jgi:hypothetical protein
MAMATEEIGEAVEWVASWGHPAGSEYLDKEVMNAALELIDELKQFTAASGELAALLGHHPPSFFNYALGLAETTLELPQMRAQSEAEIYAVAWMDGVIVGQLIMLLMFTGGDK